MQVVIHSQKAGIMALKRKALQKMLEWKRSKGKQALLVTGARQVGKTFLIRQFMRENYESSVEINLLAFQSPKSPESVFLRMLDFVFEDSAHRAVPLEVKSGKSYRRHSALSKALEIENYGIERAVVLHEGNVEVDGKVVYLPMYMTMVLD